MRRKSSPLRRGSVRAARRRSAPLPGRSQTEQPSAPTVNTRRRKPPSREGEHEQGVDDAGNGESDNSADNAMGHGRRNGDSGLNHPQTTSSENQNTSTARANGRRHTYAGTALSFPTSASGVHGESSLGDGHDSGTPTVTPCTSDIWAWALIVLQMFSDETCPPASGQV